MKRALRQTLDQQVAWKEQAKRSERAADLAQDQRALDGAALAIQEKRMRDLANKREEKEILQKTWKLQHELRKMEESVDRAARTSAY